MDTHVDIFPYDDAFGIGLAQRFANQMFLVVSWLSGSIDAPEASNKRLFHKSFRLVFLPRSTVDEGWPCIM
jgi:hypothetical protein